MSGQGAKTAVTSREELALSRYKIEQLSGVIKTALVTVSVLGVAWMAQNAFIEVAIALAGKTTDANIVMTLLNKTQFAVMASFAVGGSGLVYGLKQKKLREETVERLHGRIEELELGYDPKRTSSNLTKRGKTNPKDKT